MLDHYPTLRVHGLVDLTARPHSPVRSVGRTPPRTPPALRARAGLAGALHRLAAALEPRPTTERSRATAAPACQ